ncbi:MAG: hypothetical protein LLG01_01980 [Planctomycetaceae bacterium]|nr:hypothetical protein [Planctomycetaceae bacterium]
MKHLLTVPLIALMLAAPALAQETKTAPAAAKAEVPVTRVVLFSSGVGYFEHNGTVQGDADIRLNFKTEQINDVLKSMLVMADNGFVTGVNYASRDPLVRALKSFAVDLSGDPTMGDLLKQLRGAEVVLQAPDKITGKILTIETRKKEIIVGGQPTIVTEVILNVFSGGKLKAVPMDTVQSLELTDARLQGDLNKALELLITSHDTERKPVDIRFSGKGPSKVKIGYVSETPVWKVSYRLDLTPKKPLLQGWAIVENTSDQDWTDVNLSLVSGRPISFIMDLYTPLYLTRPTVVPEMYAHLRPQMYEGGIAPADGPVAKSMAMPAAPRAYAARRMARDNINEDQASMLASQQAGGVYGGGGASGEMSLGQSAANAMAAAGKIGELFNFTLEKPVTLQRRRSAMLPILNTPIAAEKVSIYNQAVMQRYPLNGVYLTNDTGLKMLGGPITVLDEGMYAGDARIDNIAPKDKRLISYAVDLNVTVDPSQTTSSQITSVKIVRGTLQITRLHTYQHTYRIKSTADVKRTLIIEHPFNAALKLIEPDKFEEKTPAVYRFRVDVDKEATKDFTVKLQQTESQGIGLVDCSPDMLTYYVRSGEVPENVKAALSEALAMKNQLANLERKLNDLENQKRQIEAGQQRLRENIGSVGKDSQLGQRYIKKLAEQEDQLEAMTKQTDELRQQIEQQRKKLQDYLVNLSI